MKSSSKLLTGAALLLCGHLIAQNNITLEIVHRLNEADFQLNQEAQNNLQHKFSVSRLQYYISEINITHDGGQNTAFDSIWVLVNASVATEVALGSENITNVESISFSIGVDPAHNHQDPSVWPSSHPLALHNPSMHWGWASGYRFVAMEGDAGDNLDQSYEIHALGDANYFETTVEAEGVMDNGSLVVTLYADYAQAIRDIDLTSGLIMHGETGEAKDLLENFRDYVFSADDPADTTTGVRNVAGNLNISVAPNPATDGTIHIQVNGNQLHSMNIEVFDISGKRVYSNVVRSTTGNLEITGLTRGVYFLNAVREGDAPVTKKISIL